MKTAIQTYNYLEEYIDSVSAKGRFTIEERKDKLEVTDFKKVNKNKKKKLNFTIFGD
jgi:hypothetical protein